MKKIFFVLVSLLLIFSMSVTSFADVILNPLPPAQSPVETPGETEQPAVETPGETEQSAVETPASDSALTDINNKLDTILENQSTTIDTQTETEINPPLVDDTQLVDVQFYSVAPITPNNTTGFKSVLLSVLGDYEGIVVEYQYHNDSGDYRYLREIQLDYVWLASAFIFVVIIYCVFRLGGALIG